MVLRDSKYCKISGTIHTITQIFPCDYLIILKKGRGTAERKIALKLKYKQIRFNSIFDGLTRGQRISVRFIPYSKQYNGIWETTLSIYDIKYCKKKRTYNRKQLKRTI